MPKFFQPTHSTPSDVYIFSSTPIASDDYILTPGNLYVPNDLHTHRNTRSPHNILNSPWPDVRKAVNAELNTAPTNALLKKSDTIFQFFSVSRYNAPLLYALHRELLTSIPSLSDLPAELSPSTLRFILRHLALFDNLPSHLHYLPISTLTSLIIYLSVPTLESNSRLTAPQDEPVLFLARRHLINLSPSELETFTSLPENPALYIIRRLAKRHLPHDKAFFQCLDNLANIRHYNRQ